MLSVTSAKYVSEYKLQLVFSDGKSGIVDLEGALWGSVFESLKDLERFKAFKIDDVLETVAWTNGADLAPEFLYNQLV